MLSKLVLSVCETQGNSCMGDSQICVCCTKLSVLSPGGEAQALKVTFATSTATMPMAGMPILYACLEVKPVTHMPGSCHVVAQEVCCCIYGLPSEPTVNTMGQ